MVFKYIKTLLLELTLEIKLFKKLFIVYSHQNCKNVSVFIFTDFNPGMITKPETGMNAPTRVIK